MNGPFQGARSNAAQRLRSDLKLGAKLLFGFVAFIYAYSSVVLYISDSNNYASNQKRMAETPRVLRWNRAPGEE